MMKAEGNRGRFARLLAGLSVCVAAGALSSIAVATSDGTAAAHQYEYGGKVVICHRPPGNPANMHTITVSENAVPAHMKHGDTTGPCPGQP